MMVTLQLAKAITHRRRSVSGEGQAPLFLSREEWPTGTGEKDRGQPLWTGRQLRPALSSNSTHQEKAVGRVADLEQWQTKLPIWGGIIFETTLLTRLKG
jgi:hypothetical protein